MYQLPELKDHPFLLSGCSTTDEGNMSLAFGEPSDVMPNRQAFLQKLGVSLDRCVVMRCEHKDVIASVMSQDAGRGTQDLEDAIVADALITNDPNIYLMLIIGDCVPTVLFDTKNKAIGLVHSSGFTTDMKILIHTLARMQQEYGTNLQDIEAYMGPSITVDSHIVQDPFQKDDPVWQPFLRHLDDGRTAIDAIGYSIHQLKEAGVPKDKIFQSHIDTAKDPRFFSHHQFKYITNNLEEKGLFACLVGLKNGNFS